MKKIFVLVGVMLAMGQSGAFGDPPNDPTVAATGAGGGQEKSESFEPNDAGSNMEITYQGKKVSNRLFDANKLNCQSKDMPCKDPKSMNQLPAAPKTKTPTPTSSNTGSDTFYDNGSKVIDSGGSAIVQQQGYVGEVLKSSQRISADGVAQSKMAYAKTSQDILNKPQIDEVEVRKLQQDRVLVNRAEESVFGKKKVDFTSEDAERANFPLIRANLRVVGSANELNKTAGFEYARLGSLAAQFARLSSKNRELSQKIGSNENQSIVGVAKSIDENSIQSNVSVKNESKLALLGSEKKSKEDILKDIKKIKDAYLRNKLKKQLESDLKAMNSGRSLEEAMGDSFDGKIAFNSSSKKSLLLANNFSAENNNSFEKNSDLNDSDKPFRLDSPENDRKIASIVDEVRSAAGEFEQSGILEEDSRSLFVRVSSTYRECVARKCVRLR